MRYGSTIAALGGMTIALMSADPALAARASANFGCCSEPSVSMTAPGFATAEKLSSRGFAQGNAYEFDGGVGVSAFAATNAKSPLGGALAQASGEASIYKSLRIGGSANPLYSLFDIGDDVIFEIAFVMKPSGTLSINTEPYSATVTSAAFANYSYDWNFGGLTGGGSEYIQQVFSPVVQHNVTAGLNGGLLLVRLGDVVNLYIHAKAGATAWPAGKASADAAADFSHTLRWGGITGVAAHDSMGNAIALPTGFNLSLNPIGGGMDYFNAAGANPYTSSAPEPAQWALLLTGFGLLGGAARRHARPALRTVIN